MGNDVWNGYESVVLPGVRVRDGAAVIVDEIGTMGLNFQWNCIGSSS